MGTESDLPIDDPTVTDPELYHVVMENERVRVLEYLDKPGGKTTMHHHPDSVMVTLSSFGRRLQSGDQVADIVLESGQVRWLADQSHAGENTGQSDTHVILVELKEPRPTTPDVTPGSQPIGPTAS